MHIYVQSGGNLGFVSTDFLVLRQFKNLRQCSLRYLLLITGVIKRSRFTKANVDML